MWVSLSWVDIFLGVVQVSCVNRSSNSGLRVEPVPKSREYLCLWINSLLILGVFAISQTELLAACPPNSSNSSVQLGSCSAVWFSSFVLSTSRLAAFGHLSALAGPPPPLPISFPDTTIFKWILVISFSGTSAADSNWFSISRGKPYQRGTPYSLATLGSCVFWQVFSDFNFNSSTKQ